MKFFLSEECDLSIRMPSRRLADAIVVLERIVVLAKTEHSALLSQLHVKEVKPNVDAKAC